MGQSVVPEQQMRPAANDHDAVKVRTERIEQNRKLLIVAFGDHRRAFSTRGWSTLR